MFELIITHWPSILVVLAFIALIIFLTVRGKKDIVSKMLYSLVTEAEKIYGSGTGSVKFAYVIEKAYNALPPILKLFITYERLKIMIENTLTVAKAKWAEEAGVTEYLSTTTPKEKEL